MRFHGYLHCQACRRDRVPLVPVTAQGDVTKWVCLDPAACLETHKRRSDPPLKPKFLPPRKP